MNLVVGAFVVVLVTACTVGLMLLVRRRAPEGSYFADGDRASGVFGVLATGFAVILGFIIFLAFESYDASRTGAETEALTVVQQVETAQFLPPERRDELTGMLLCYARSVIATEWPAMDAGRSATRSTPGVRRCSGRCARTSRRRRRSSRRTTGGWTRPASGSRHGSTACTASRVWSRSRSGSGCSSSLA